MPSRSRFRQPKVSDAVMEQLETMILDGTLRAGEKLPPERELAKEFEVSRPSLREALQKLEAKGLLYSRQGGGSYVTDSLERAFSDPLAEIMATNPEANYDLLEFRHALEGISAYYAALRGTDADREIIKLRFDAMMRAHDRMDSAQEAKADAEFHLSIAEAAHNVFLLHVLRALFGLLEKSIITSLETLYTREHSRREIPRQHTELLEAILAGDPKAARQAVHDHLAFVEETMLNLGREHSRKERALRRLESLRH
ncbi:MAG: pyruvate dehydrogenase complex transcriptional repressor PdhR [Gammaproteobacteria bacterium]|nr:pyruvate dehydrogenase complex transcriptional repressor PdhR [Gammaproteobacteria bacterium]